MIVFARVCIAILLLCASPAFGQPEGVHLSWNTSRGGATQRSIAITWSDEQLSTGFVKYGVGATSLKSRRAKVEFSAAMKTYIYQVVLTRLEAGMRYYYRCGSDENGWSGTYSFHTGPEKGSTSRIVVGVWGDTQDNEFNTSFEKTGVIVGEMLKYPADFTIHMGDIVNNGSEISSWKRFFNITQLVNAALPFMPVTGNHDVVNDAHDAGFQQAFPVFHDLFNLPGDEMNYSFDYGNAHFVAINSGYASGADKSGQVLFAEGSREYQWLQKDLQRARKNRNIDWIILYAHYPLYAYGVSYVPAWRDHIAPLLDKYGVDLCLAGHRHVYERHAAIRGPTIVPPTDGHSSYHKPTATVYITNGTAGGSPQGIGGFDLPSMVFTPRKRMYNFAIMTIEGNALTYKVYDEANGMIDSVEIIR